jgi:hypothetical protein
MRNKFALVDAKQLQFRLDLAEEAQQKVSIACASKISNPLSLSILPNFCSASSSAYIFKKIEMIIIQHTKKIKQEATILTSKYYKKLFFCSTKDKDLINSVILHS